MRTAVPSSKDGRLPAAEARLLEQINRGFSDAWWDHYDKLLRKRDDEQLTTLQQRELIRLTGQIERREAKRLEALARLARRRKQSLNDLMTLLGVTRQRNG
jgi:hypothetical protein